jgi:hypothetical protein
MDDFSGCKIHNFIGLNNSNSYTPKMWKNAKFLAPDASGNHRRLDVELFINNKWFPYTLSLDDIHCPFEREKVFQQIIDTNECKCYIPPSEEEILNEKRMFMMIKKYQFKAQLAEMNLLNIINDVIANAPIKIKIIYDEITDIPRLSILIKTIIENTIITDELMDEIFEKAIYIKI